MAKNFFKTNPEKAASKVMMNTFMIGGLFVVFSVILTKNPQETNPLVILQLILAMPLLFVSSLAYTKVSYYKEVKLWDYLGWYTNTIGNAFTLNSIGLLTSVIDRKIAYLYFGFVIVLMLIYSIINLSLNPDLVSEKIYKFFFFIFITLFLGLLPLISGIL
jgi:hypothetical protein